MLEGMRADFLAIDALSQRLVERARRTERITCRTPHGTDFEAEFSPKLKWLKTSGIITPGKVGQSSWRRNFYLTVEHQRRLRRGRRGRRLSLPEIWRSAGDTPLTIEVERQSHSSICNAITRICCDDFRAYTSTDENSNRVGEFAIGTNTACTHVIGNILQDEKIPGIHIAFGHPYAEHTGANWISKTHIDCVGRDFDIWFDGEQVMARGKFLI